MKLNESWDRRWACNNMKGSSESGMMNPVWISSNPSMRAVRNTRFVHRDRVCGCACLKLFDTDYHVYLLVVVWRKRRID